MNTWNALVFSSCTTFIGDDVCANSMQAPPLVLASVPGHSEDPERYSTEIFGEEWPYVLKSRKPLKSISVLWNATLCWLPQLAIISFRTFLLLMKRQVLFSLVVLWQSYKSEKENRLFIKQNQSSPSFMMKFF